MVLEVRASVKPVKVRKFAAFCDRISQGANPGLFFPGEQQKQDKQVHHPTRIGRQAQSLPKGSHLLQQTIVTLL